MHRRYDVDKIVIISDRIDRSISLWAFLNELFPECEISIISSTMENLEAQSIGSSSGIRKEDAARRESCLIF
jgi:hypothetical protein